MEETMELRGKKVLVIGTGISGVGAAQLLHKKGALPVLYDDRTDVPEGEIREKRGVPEGLPIVLGSLSPEQWDGIELVVVSPGVPCDSPLVREFRERGIKVWGEIELAFAEEKGRIAAITGTNGKTTTTSLVGEIMAGCGGPVFVVGNIGNPYTAVASQTTPESVTVAEISSFQLETVEHFCPDVSAILNITPDHLNRHHTMENYAAAKEAIAANQTKAQVCVLNYDNPYTRAFGERCPARVVYFSSAARLEEGIYLDGEELVLAEGGETQRLMNIHDMRLVGMCNVENVMAAIAISMNMGAPLPDILRTVKRFKAVEHRIEFVASKGGVDFYNDSKGTNPDAAIQGIKAMSKPTLLIGGGYDKQSEYDEWIEAFDGKVKCLVLIGQTREKIAKCAKRHGVDNVVLADDLREAFQVCVERAEPGDAVLLSPACASWGMFSNYEERGRMFKDYVHELSD